MGYLWGWRATISWSLSTSTIRATRAAHRYLSHILAQINIRTDFGNARAAHSMIYGISKHTTNNKEGTHSSRWTTYIYSLGCANEHRWLQNARDPKHTAVIGLRFYKSCARPTLYLAVVMRNWRRIASGRLKFHATEKLCRYMVKRHH